MHGPGVPALRVPGGKGVTARGRKAHNSVTLCNHDGACPAASAEAARQISALRDVMAAEAVAGQAGTSDAGDPADGYTDSQDLQDSQESQETHRHTPASATSAEEELAAPSLWSLPLPQFVKAVVVELEDYDEPFPSPFFHFVRKLRSFWAEGTITADAAFDEVTPIIRRLGRGWPAGGGNSELDDEEAYTEFVTLWAKVRYRADETPLTNAAVKAKAYPLGTLRSNKKRPLPGYDRFISLAGWLQVSMGDRPIMLPCRACAEALKTTSRMVSIWRQWAVEDEFLKVQQEHRYHPGGKSEATVFRFDVGRWKCLSKVAQRGTQSSFDVCEFFPTIPERPTE